MPKSDDTTRLRREWDVLFDRIFDAGRKQGSSEAISRIENMMRKVMERDIARAEPPPHPEVERVRLPYGAAKNAVRKALVVHPHGIKKPDIQTWCEDNVGVRLKMDSITEALKSLAKDREAENPERGIWMPGSEIDLEKLGAAAPSDDEGLFHEEDK